MRASYKILLNIIVWIFCFPVSGNDITVEKKFSFQYADNRKQQHSIIFFELWQKNGRGPKYIVAANEHWKHDSLNFKEFLSAKDHDTGIIKKIIWDSHPLPAIRGSFFGFPVITEYGFHADSDSVWIIIENYGRKIRCWTFSKDENGIYSISKESQWPSSFIRDPGKKHQVLWNGSTAFLCKTANGSTNAFQGRRLLKSGPVDPITPLMPVFYPFCPSEIAFFSDDEKRQENSNACFEFPPDFAGVKINGRLLNSKKIEGYIDRYLKAAEPNEYSIGKLIFSSVIASLMEDVLFSDPKSLAFEFDAQKHIHSFFTQNNLPVPENTGMNHFDISNIKRKYAASAFVEKHRSAPVEVSEEEIRSLFQKTKCLFCRKFERNSEICQFPEVKSFLKQQIQRLKYYGMTALPDMPLKIEMIWVAPQNIPRKRGFFDPLPPDELERRKREFLASQPLKELFTEMELKELFAEPDYTKITDPLELARAFDWAGKYPEALAALKKAQGPEAQFDNAFL